MARRPIFVPLDRVRDRLVDRLPVEFDWYPGFSLSQKRACIASLHAAASKKYPDIRYILEVSTKSDKSLGFRLSAFNLKVCHPLDDSRWVDLESVFQGSKVFEDEGPYHRLYDLPARDAKRFMKVRGLGSRRVTSFQCGEESWPTEPKTAFYDWLYVKAVENPGFDGQDLGSELLASNYDAFTDIEFNPRRSWNCQAHSCALYLALSKRNQLRDALHSKQSFVDLLGGYGHSTTDGEATKVNTPRLQPYENGEGEG